MKLTPVSPADLQASVIAVPPLARNADLTLNREANRALISYMEAGGVRSLMYGGNANFYNLPLSEYAATLDFLAEAAGADTWMLPSAGPDYGRLIDQAAVLRERRFPTAMVLPSQFPSTDAGIARGIRKFADILGKPAVIYLKSENQIAADTLAALVKDGLVCSIKYAVVREKPEVDAYLSAIIERIGTDIVVSGIGERPAIVHMRDFGLKSMTSGSICVGPRGSMKLHALLKAKRYDEAAKIRQAYMPLEDCRDGMSPIRVLHDAVTLAGIADMGPMLPLLSNLSEAQREVVGPVARALRAYDAALDAAKAA
ncbi:MAG: dihydrodipicolinate synthase family protein [Betaproteobacteria bacterium]